MKTINQKLLKQFLRLAGDRLEGRWVLLGGTLLPLLGIDDRFTTDIDLAGLGKKEQAQTLSLMNLAEELGLPVESINQAAAYFLMKQAPFEDHLLELHRGKSAEILRPDLYLFLVLKIGRLSPSDLSDCIALLAKEGPLARDDSKKVIKLIDQKLKPNETSELEGKSERLALLRNAVSRASEK